MSIKVLVISLLFFTWSCGDSSDETEKPIPLFQSPFEPYVQLSDNASFVDIEGAYSALQAALSNTPRIFTQRNSRARAVERADKIMSDGWELRGNLIDINAPINWGFQPGKDKNYTFTVNAMNFTEILIYAYQQTSDDKYMESVLDVFLDWHKYNITDDKANDFKWYDMSTGLRAVQLSYLLHWAIEKKIPVDIILSLLASAEAHLTQLSDPNLKGKGNHLLFQMHGIVALCKNVPVLTKCTDTLNYAFDNFAEEMSKQFKADGMHTEHSPGYHMYVITIVTRLFESNWYDESLAQMIDKPSYLIPWLYHPNGDTVVIGDSEHDDINMYKALHQNVQYFTSDGAIGEAPQLSSLGFLESGYAVFRDSWDKRPLNEHSFLFFNASFHSSIHKHRDDFTFSWSEFGLPIIVDSGKFTYSAGPARQYATSTRAHNTVEISNSNYTSLDEHAYGSALDYFDENQELQIGALEASAYRPKFNVNHTRNIFYRKKEWVLVVDKFHNTSRRFDYVQWFHLTPEAELVFKTHDHVTFYLPSINKYFHIVDIIETTQTTEVIKGQTEPDWQGWFSPKYEVYIPNYAVGVSQRGSNEQLATLLYLSDKKEIAFDGTGSIGLEELSVCWSANNKSSGLRFSKLGEGRLIETCN